jgi:hypothetical protein
VNTFTMTAQGQDIIPNVYGLCVIKHSKNIAYDLPRLLFPDRNIASVAAE